MARNVYENIDIHGTNVQLGNTYITQAAKSDFEEFLALLFLTDASADLLKTIRLNGKRIAGTCEWILFRREYEQWHAENGLQILWLLGDPGVGKTAISCFLIDNLQKQAASQPSTVLIYHFCDYKDDGPRNSALGIIRCILEQLLKKQPHLFRWITARHQHRYERSALVNNLDGLWEILLQLLQKCEDKNIYILIDALDECDKTARTALLGLIAEIPASVDVKVLITARPDVEIKRTAEALGQCLRVDSGKINADLASFIDSKLAELRVKRSFQESLINAIGQKVKNQAGGTFLWVSLVFKDISAATTTKAATRKLEHLPSDLPGIYKRILNAIDETEEKDAAFILRSMVASKRPMTATEMATAQVLSHEGWHTNTVPPVEYIKRFEDGFKACGHILYYDPVNGTLNFIHRTVKDYLVEGDCPPKYRVNIEEAGTDLVGACWQYLSMKDFGQGEVFLLRDHKNTLIPIRPNRIGQKQYSFLSFAFDEVQDLEGEDRLALYAAFVRSCRTINSLPTLRDYWLFHFARAGHADGVQALIQKDADVNVRCRLSDYKLIATKLFLPRTMEFWNNVATDFETHAATATVLQAAAREGHAEICRVLIEKGAEVDAVNEANGETALHLAAKFGRQDVVCVLLDNGAGIDKFNVEGRSPLSMALYEGCDKIGVLLLTRGANAFLEVSASRRDAPFARNGVNETDFSRGSRQRDQRELENMLFHAAMGGCVESISYLLEMGLNIEARNSNGQTALSAAVDSGNINVAKVLAKNGADLGVTEEDTKETLLHLATARGYLGMVAWLARVVPDLNARANCARHRLPLMETHSDSSDAFLMGHYTKQSRDISEKISPLQLAAILGDAEIYRVLAQAGANRDVTDSNGRGVLHDMARYGHQNCIVSLAQSRGLSIGNKDERGWTALHHAAVAGHFQTVLQLVRSTRADINALTQRGETALHLVAQLSTPDDGSGRDAWVTQWLHSGSISNVSAMAKLLLEEGADAGAVSSVGGNTALHLAVMQGSWPVTKVLLEYGVDVRSVNQQGKTPVDLAATGQAEAYQLGGWNMKAYEKIAQLLSTYSDCSPHI